MKRIAIAVLALSFTFGGIFSVKIAMADTTNKQENTDINYDSPLMTDDDSDSLAKMNLENYDVKDTTNVTKEVDSYNTEKVASNYGIDSDKVIDNENSKTDSKTDSKDNSKKETTTHTNLPMDENDENYTSPDITYYEPNGEESTSSEGTDYNNGDSNDSGYSDYKYSYSTLAKSVMLRTLRHNEEFSQASKKRQEVILYALQYVGNRYVFGGTSITNGIDCSAFTRYVMNHFGKKLPRNSYSQRSVGKSVDKPNTGDLICYSGHVAIYIGDGKIVHASNHHAYPRGGIKVSSSYKYRTVKSIRSLFN
ncbi:C40 family peptidase [Anaerobutyricum soehngenii]|mgnify:FL=1|uniref:C40 family peptidase n=1 Tax=Anaerobutyricum soehngenii TaxID=105843 RepID=UPI0032C04190